LRMRAAWIEIRHALSALGAVRLGFGRWGEEVWRTVEGRVLL
jgi:hypothetical protein